MYPWESKELVELKNVRDSVSKIWNHTELNNENTSRSFLLNELSIISDLVNDALLGIDTELDRLVNRDCKAVKEYTCSHCEGDKIFVCDPCMDDWSKDV